MSAKVRRFVVVLLIVAAAVLQHAFGIFPSF
jgi:hypothetical protein